MKALVIYFSQTGNTKKVADAIKEGIESKGIQCDITPLTTGLASPSRPLRDMALVDVAKYDLIGIGTFALDWKDPVPVGNMIKNMPPLKGKHVFLFATHGMRRGEIFPSMAEKVRAKGGTVIGFRSWYGTSWTLWTQYPYLSDGHPDAQDLEEATDFGKEMVEQSTSIARGEKDLIPVIPSPKDIASPEVFNVELRLNREKCTYPKCGICIEVCPVAAIDLSANPVVFAKGCIYCYMCEKVCPRGAIEGDWEPLTKVWKEQFTQGAMTAAARGEEKGFFRRLSSFSPDNPPMYQALSKRPRFRVKLERKATEKKSG